MRTLYAVLPRQNTCILSQSGSFIRVDGHTTIATSTEYPRQQIWRRIGVLTARLFRLASMSESPSATPESFKAVTSKTGRCMTEKKFQELRGGLIKKRERRIVGVFIDGINLDRATRRVQRKVDLQALVRGVCSGSTPVVARYYTVIPHEDDSRQHAFLDAVSRAGLTVIVKRLPPKGIERQVATDIEMASDIVAFSLGLSSFSKENEYLPVELEAAKRFTVAAGKHDQTGNSAALNPELLAPTPRSEGPLLHVDAASPDTRRSIVIICPSRELAYSISLAKNLGADTTTADFSKFAGGDVLKSAAKWIDLSGSETIWKE